MSQEQSTSEGSSNCPVEGVVLGASAGGVEALLAILSALPSEYALPLMVVLHIPRHKDSLLTEIFASRCRIKVKEGEDKEVIQPGIIYFAPPDYHMLVEQDKRLSLSSDEPVLHSRPSIDVLFESAADAYGEGLIAIVLTGGNSDGARGIHAVARAGGIAIVQDPALAHAPVMPAAALEAVPHAKRMSIEEISRFLQSMPERGKQ